MRAVFVSMLLFFSLSITVNAQGKLDYTLTILNDRGAPMENTPVTLIETSSKERISLKTNSSGKVSFTLTTGKEWSVNILKMKNYMYIKRSDRASGKGAATITYDYYSWERKNRPLIDRSKLTIEKIQQQGISERSATRTEAIMKLVISKQDETPLKNYPVTLTCYKLQKSFTTTTNSSGMAIFKVPANNEYDIDIDGIDAFNYIDAFEAGVYTLSMTYEPTDLTETNVRDTITQKFKKMMTGTSGRTLSKFRITCTDCESMSNEWIYISEIGTTKVYKAKLNSDGEAEMLLPVRRKYMIEFEYQPEVDVLDLSQVKGISEYNRSVTYVPDPVLKYPEKYLPSPGKLLERSFQDFITKQYAKPKESDQVGLALKWTNPTINKDSKEALLTIGFNAEEQKPDPKSPPINICIVVDRSGSMEGADKIGAVKSSLLNFISKLRSKDIVSLVSFDDSAYVLVPSATKGDGTYLRDMIEDLVSGGGTNIYAGLEEGYKQVQKSLLPKSTNRVILLTDGYDGIPVDSTTKMSKRYNAKGIELSAVGIGNGYNHALLSLLANKSGGLLQLSPKADNMEEIFTKELNSLLLAVATNVTVEIDYNHKLEFKQLFGYKSKLNKPGLVTFQMDNIYAGLNTLAFVSFKLQNADKSLVNKPVTVRLKYFDAKKNAQVTLMEQAFLKWSETTGELELILEREEKKLYAIAVANQFVKSMTDEFEKGNYTDLKKLADDCIRQLKDNYPDASDPDINELKKKLVQYSSLTARVIQARK